MVAWYRKPTPYLAAGLVGLWVTVSACGGNGTATQPANDVSQAASDAAPIDRPVTRPPNTVTPVAGNATPTVQPITQPLKEVSLAESDAAPPNQPATRPGGAFGFTHFVFEQVGGDVVTSLVEGPRGPQIRVPISFPALEELLESGKVLPEELGLDREQLANLVDQLETIRLSTEKYRDVKAALADGYVQAGGVVPNMGAHFVNEDRINDGVLNLEEPEIVLYDRDKNGEWRLAGTAFVLPREDDPASSTQGVGDNHPEGFAGPLDNWHVHYQLCTLPDGQFRTLGEADCQAKNGNFNASYGWMIHAWVHDDNPLGVFSMWNSNIPPTSLGEAGILSTRQADHDEVEGSAKVTIQNFAHGPIELAVGDSITWLNADGVPHTVTSGSAGIADGGFDSGWVGPGQIFTQRVDQPGSFAFTCTIHPQMNGIITVK